MGIYTLMGYLDVRGKLTWQSFAVNMSAASAAMKAAVGWGNAPPA